MTMAPPFTPEATMTDAEFVDALAVREDMPDGGVPSTPPVEGSEVPEEGEAPPAAAPSPEMVALQEKLAAFEERTQKLEQERETERSAAQARVSQEQGAAAEKVFTDAYNGKLAELTNTYSLPSDDAKALAVAHAAEVWRQSEAGQRAFFNAFLQSPAFTGSEFYRGAQSMALEQKAWDLIGQHFPHQTSYGTALAIHKQLMALGADKLGADARALLMEQEAPRLAGGQRDANRQRLAPNGAPLIEGSSGGGGSDGTTMSDFNRLERKYSAGTASPAEERRYEQLHAERRAAGLIA